MLKRLIVNIIAIGLILPMLSIVHADVASKSFTKVGTKELVSKLDNLEIEVVVQSPSAQVTPLQIICVFEYTEDDIFTSPPALPKELNGLVHVDESLKGLLTDLRKTHKFEGHALETLLILPPPNTIPANKLLVIGLGKKEDFNPELMRFVGITGMREALRLNVPSYSHASDLKDSGIDSPTAEVAGNVVRGAVEAYATQKYLVERRASEPLKVTKMTLLCGPAFYDDSKAGVLKGLSSAEK